ncbi:MAG: RluA family pseudouridine synthase [Candidatus Omnitrophica bacterium]|nr:RluA family pseudouridine synthase [Candidatus Omnitrophota bacterium]
MNGAGERSEDDLYVETDFKILYEEEGFLIADKPAPLPVHPVGRFTRKNLLSLLRERRPEDAGGLRIVNRLDSETSGLVVVAKSSGMAGRLGMLFEQRRVKKEYRAVVRGRPSKREAVIEIRLGTVHRGSLHMRKPDPAGETASTRYEILQSGPGCSLLRLMPLTGRKHQIRAHLAFIGHPVLGDKVYIDTRIFERYIREGWSSGMKKTVRSERLLLHASGLEFPHPVTGEIQIFKSEPPALFGTFLRNEADKRGRCALKAPSARPRYSSGRNRSGSCDRPTRRGR